VVNQCERGHRDYEGDDADGSNIQLKNYVVTALYLFGDTPSFNVHNLNVVFYDKEYKKPTLHFSCHSPD